MLATVRVTNPIARNDPEAAIDALAQAIEHLPIDLIETTVKEIQSDPNAIWPTSGHIIDTVQRKIRIREAKEQRRKPTPSSEEFKRRRADRAMRSDVGQYAIGLGIGATYQLDIEQGKLAPDEPLTDGYIDRARRAKRERIALSERIKDGVDYPDIPGHVRASLVSLSERMDQYENALMHRYAKI